MSWPLSLLVSLVTAVLGLLATGVVANAFASWYRWSSFEGAAGYAVVGLALLGGIAGLVLGGVVARSLTAPASLARALAISCGIVLGLAGTAAAEARFAAMDPGAPLVEWIAWTRSDATPPQQAAALLGIAARSPVATSDPQLTGTPDVAVRFAGWMAAARALRAQAGADLTPELASILDLARTLPDDRLMRSDVVRIASDYMREWAGVAPLPSDPPPR